MHVLAFILQLWAKTGNSLLVTSFYNISFLRCSIFPHSQQYAKSIVNIVNVRNDLHKLCVELVRFLAFLSQQINH